MSKHFKSGDVEEIVEPAPMAADVPETWHEQKTRLKRPRGARPKHKNIIEFTASPPSRLRFTQEQWDATPDEIKSEICRSMREMTAGFEKYRSTAERDAELEPWHEMAKAAGTTLPAALSRYIAMENLLRSEPERGIEAVIRNLGLDPADVATLILADCRGYPAQLVAQIAQAVRDGKVEPGTHWAGSTPIGPELAAFLRDGVPESEVA
jgi:hypothetical protein